MIGVVVGLEEEARIARRLPGEIMVAVGGGSADGARRAAERLQAQGARGLISFGYAAGLSPALSPGTLVVPRLVITDSASFEADAALAAWLGGPTPHDLLHSERVVATAADKARLFARTGCAVLDMESGALARAALAERQPFAVLRAICDPAARSLPPAALLAIAGDGRVEIGRVLRSIMARPTQIPALLELARDSHRAKTALARRIRTLRPPL